MPFLLLCKECNFVVYMFALITLELLIKRKKSFSQASETMYSHAVERSFHFYAILSRNLPLCQISMRFFFIFFNTFVECQINRPIESLKIEEYIEATNPFGNLIEYNWNIISSCINSFAFYLRN